MMFLQKTFGPCRVDLKSVLLKMGKDGESDGACEASCHYSRSYLFHTNILGCETSVDGVRPLGIYLPSSRGFRSLCHKQSNSFSLYKYSCLLYPQWKGMGAGDLANCTEPACIASVRWFDRTDMQLNGIGKDTAVDCWSISLLGQLVLLRSPLMVSGQ